MTADYVVVFITAPSKESGRQVARALVEQGMAACVNILAPVNSIYRWEGKVYDEEEALLVVKTRAARLETDLIPAVQALHPYQTPEIIALPIQAGLPDYLAWIEAVTGQA